MKFRYLDFFFFFFGGGGEIFNFGLCFTKIGYFELGHFGMHGKRRWYRLPWLQVSGEFYFLFHRGDGNHPLGKLCYKKKRLGRTRVNFPWGECVYVWWVFMIYICVIWCWCTEITETIQNNIQYNSKHKKCINTINCKTKLICDNLQRFWIQFRRGKVVNQILNCR